MEFVLNLSDLFVYPVSLVSFQQLVKQDYIYRKFCGVAVVAVPRGARTIAGISGR